jgi:ADP-ribosylglycohydrolase
LSKPLGEGWIAEEALGISVFASLTHPSDFADAVLLAVNHSGDSDSTGSITGQLVATALGIDAIPTDWIQRLELADVIDRLASELYELIGSRS